MHRRKQPLPAVAVASTAANTLVPRAAKPWAGQLRGHAVTSPRPHCQPRVSPAVALVLVSLSTHPRGAGDPKATSPAFLCPYGRAQRMPNCTTPPRGCRGSGILGAVEGTPLAFCWAPHLVLTPLQPAAILMHLPHRLAHPMPHSSPFLFPWLETSFPFQISCGKPRSFAARGPATPVGAVKPTPAASDLPYRQEGQPVCVTGGTVPSQSTAAGRAEPHSPSAGLRSAILHLWALPLFWGRHRDRSKSKASQNSPGGCTQTPEGCWQLVLLLCIPVSCILQRAEFPAPLSAPFTTQGTEESKKPLASHILPMPGAVRAQAGRCSPRSTAAPRASARRLRERRIQPGSSVLHHRQPWARGTGQLPWCGIGAQGGQDPLLPPQSYPPAARARRRPHKGRKGTGVPGHGQLAEKGVGTSR